MGHMGTTFYVGAGISTFITGLGLVLGNVGTYVSIMEQKKAIYIEPQYLK